jgi:hypothetical protein
MPMMPFIGVRISWLMFARNSRFHRAVARRHQGLVARLQLRGARVHSALEVVLMLKELLVALLYIAQHRVELIDQLADLVVVSRVRADVVAAAVAHEPRHLDEPFDRTEDQPRRGTRQTDRNPEGAEQRDRGDGREAGESGPDFGGIRLDDDLADHLVIEGYRPLDAQVVPLEQRDAFHTGRNGVVLGELSAPRQTLSHIRREQRAVRREEPGVEDVLVHRRRAERVGRRHGVLEGEGRRAVGADNIGEHRDVADQAGTAVQVVVAGENDAGRDQRHTARDRGGRGELAPDRLAAEPRGETMDHDRSV